MDINTPATFGSTPNQPSGPGLLFTAADAPEPSGRAVPSVKRVMEGEGCNVILFRFVEGQRLKEHKAAWPISVQCLSGELRFGWGTQEVTLSPGALLYLPAMEPHWVAADGDAVLALQMHTQQTQ